MKRSQFRWLIPSLMLTGQPVAVRVRGAATPAAQPTQAPASTTTTLPPTPIPMPPQSNLTGTRYELQEINNCGPATMAMMLSYRGWKGNQTVI